MSVPGNEGLNSGQSGERQEKLAQLRDFYVTAQKLALRGQPHENLDWILGQRRDFTQDSLEFQTKTIELIRLWLDDLIAELEERPSSPLSDSERAAPSASSSRYEAARALRDATQVFLEQFRKLPAEENRSRASD